MALPKTEGDLTGQAKASLAQWGPEQAGTSFADFYVIHLEKEPGQVVICHHSDILGYVSPEEFGAIEPSDVMIELMGRAKRDRMLGLNVVHRKRGETQMLELRR